MHYGLQRDTLVLSFSSTYNFEHEVHSIFWVALFLRQEVQAPPRMGQLSQIPVVSLMIVPVGHSLQVFDFKSKA